MQSSSLFKRTVFLAFFIVIILVLFLRGFTATQAQTTRPADTINQTFSQASKDSGVPAPLLKALCYNAIFASAFTVTEYGTTNLWYEINYNHRQAWVPATEITTL